METVEERNSPMADRLPTDEDATTDPEVRARVRRFATLRAALRALRAVEQPAELDEGLELGRQLLTRLRALSGDSPGADVLDSAEALRGADALLDRLAQRVHDVFKSTPTSTLCAAVGSLAESEPGTVRSLGAVIVESDLESEPAQRLLEYLVTALACAGAPGERTVVRPPLDALPELADIDLPAAHEADPTIDEAEQIFGRAVRRLYQDDVGATRDRIRDYKRRLGPRILHPTVMAAAVAYNTAMSNRLERLIEEHRALDALAETLLGPETTDEENASRLSNRSVALPRIPAAATRSRLFWKSLAAFGLAGLLLTLALLLWPRASVEVLEAATTSDLSSHLVAGHVAIDDGTPRFVGTLGESWDGLPLLERRLAVARIAARLAGRGVQSVVLMDEAHAIQARHEGDALLWVMTPERADP
jgi:hypothetical protein